MSQNVRNGRLKYIKLHNFKSYKGEQIVGPFKNFSAIIGPNGSGKSNLMDAISFVLGEQTKSLRVKRLSDLIHGAVLGRPASKSASVTAVYEISSNTGGNNVDPSTGDDVTGGTTSEEMQFTRVICGNTSEYRINGMCVRMDEYAEMLERINILMRAKNFLVYQGAVESIAMKNAKERCQMFEEISKSHEFREEYEQARQETQNLEQESTFNLNKKKTIVAERKEAKIEIDEAEKYKKTLAELTAKRVEFVLFRLYYNKEEMKAICGELEKKEKRCGDQQTERLTLEDEMKRKRKELSKLHRDQTGLEQDIKKCEQRVARKKPEHIKLFQRVKHLADKQTEVQRQLDAARQQHTNHLAEVRRLEAERTRIDSLQAEYERQQSQLSLEQGRNLELEASQLQRYHRLKQRVAEQTSHLSAVLDGLHREHNEQKDICDALERRRAEIQSSQKRKESEMSENLRRVQKYVEFIESSRLDIESHKRNEAVIRKEVDEATQRMEEINKELESVVMQLGEARIERHESSRAVKKQELIESLKRLFPGVYGRLLEMCQPSHRRYQVAITKVLGKHMDAVVCDTQKTAKECIQYMKDQRIEPETFLPLDYLDVRPIDEKLREIRDPANVHLVLDVIQYDPPLIKRALQFACGNALVCDTVEHAKFVAFSTGERKKTVSLDGTLFQRSGVISGGASDLKARARRWDEKQITTLVNRRDTLQDELKEQVRRRRKEAELRNIQTQIKGLEMRLKYTQKDKDSAEEKVKRSGDEDVAEMASELEQVEERAERCQTRMQELQIQINAEKAKMDTAEDDVFAEFCRQIGVDNIRVYEEKELSVAKERDRKRMEFKKQLQKLQTQLDYERSSDTLAAVTKFETSIAAEKVEMDKLHRMERKIKDEMQEEENAKAAFEARFADLKKDSEVFDVELTESRRKLGSIQKEMAKTQKEMTQVEAQLENRKAERHSLFQQAKMEDLDIPLRHGHLNDWDTGGGGVAGGGTHTQGSSQDYEQGDLMDTQQQQQGGATTTQEEMARIYETEARIPVDYKRLDRNLHLKNLKDEAEVARKMEEMQAEIDRVSSTLHRFHAPNLRATDKLGNVEERLRSTENEFEETRRRAKRAKAQFEKVKRQRYDRFMNCFNKVADNIDSIYKSLARNQGAQASLLPTNPEEPYLDEVQFQCVAPGKRFQQMDSLSGGEKTIAALALLFATHAFNPSPFFVLDEIDAALDNTNIGKVASFIQEYAKERAQIIVISLKEEFYSKADALIGIYPEIHDNCLTSLIATLDLDEYQEDVED